MEVLSVYLGGLTLLWAFLAGEKNSRKGGILIGLVLISLPYINEFSRYFVNLPLLILTVVALVGLGMGITATLLSSREMLQAARFLSGSGAYICFLSLVSLLSRI